MAQTEAELAAERDAFAELCAEYDAFLKKTGLPQWSADELWHELANRIERAETETETLRAQRDWVWGFWMRWEALEDAERMARAN